MNSLEYQLFKDMKPVIEEANKNVFLNGRKKSLKPVLIYSLPRDSVPELPQDNLFREWKRISPALQKKKTSQFLDLLAADQIGWRKTGSVNA